MKGGQLIGTRDSVVAMLAAAVSMGAFGRAFFPDTVARSSRTADEILGELRAFYRQRPRPWRSHQRVRSKRRGPVYRKAVR